MSPIVRCGVPGIVRIVEFHRFDDVERVASQVVEIAITNVTQPEKRALGDIDPLAAPRYRGPRK